MKNFFTAFLLIVTLTFINCITIECDIKRVNLSLIPGTIILCDATIQYYQNPMWIDAVALPFGYYIGDIGALRLQSRNLTYFPININVFPFLKSVDFSNSSISSMTPVNLTGLVTLSMSDNKLVSLDGDLFSLSPMLRQVEFNNNQLQHVGHNLLSSLSQLEIATFTNNPCINRQATTQSEIQALNNELPIRCPPLPATTTLEPLTTTPPAGECPIRCSLNDEVDSLKNETIELRNEIVDLKKRLTEIERQSREYTQNQSF